MKVLSIKRISILLTMISLIIWSFSLLQTRLEIGTYGIIGGFPGLYFAAIGILTIASAILWRSKDNHGYLLAIQLFILVASIWLAPLMVGAVQKLYAVAYGHLGWTEYIVRTGYLNAETLWYLNWPGNFILQSAALLITGADIDNFAAFLPWLPIIWQFILFFPVFIFFKNTLGNANPNYAWAGMWIFYLGNWSGLQNNGPQPFGIFCAFSVLAILSSTRVWKNNATVLGNRLSAVLVFAAAATVHMLGSFIALAFSGGLWLFRKVASPRILIVAVVFVAIWSMYGGIDFFNSSLSFKVLQGFRVDEALQMGTSTYMTGNAAYSAVNKIKMLLSGMFILASLAGGVLAFTWARKRDSNKDGNMAALAAALGCMVVAVAVGAGYRGEIFNRFFLYLLPFVAYFAVKLLHQKYLAVILSLILIIGMPLSFISQHGNQTMDNVPQGYLSGLHVFNDYTIRGWIDSSGPLGQYSNRERYHFAGHPYSDLAWDTAAMKILYGRHWLKDGLDGSPDYISTGTFDSAVQGYYDNEPELVEDTQKLLDTATNCNVVFANPDMQLYIRQ